jgi:hypothetical protein
MQRERYFIATGLVFLLERFAQRCVYSAYESGFNEPEHGHFRVNHTLPELSYDGIDGDWRSLPPELMFRLSQMPVLQQEAKQSIESAFGNDNPYDGSTGLSEINKHSSRLGLRAIRLSRELRQICSMPHDDSLPITGLPGVCFQSRVRGALMLSCVMPAVTTNIMLLLE